MLAKLADDEFIVDFGAIALAFSIISILTIILGIAIFSLSLIITGCVGFLIGISSIVTTIIIHQKIWNTSNE